MSAEWTGHNTATGNLQSNRFHAIIVKGVDLA